MTALVITAVVGAAAVFSVGFWLGQRFAEGCKRIDRQIHQ